MLRDSSILFSGHQNYSKLYCGMVWLINLSHSYTSATGTDKICSSVWETFHKVFVNFRVHSAAVTRFMNQQILKEKTKQLHIIILYVFVQMYGLITLAYFLYSFLFLFGLLVDVMRLIFAFFFNRSHFSVYN